MKAIQVHQFVSEFKTLDEKAMSMNRHVDMPKIKKNELLIKVLACSISPGDVTMVRGNLIFLHEAFPYVPGMDVCGIVEEPNGSNFQKGDIVVAANGISPVGGMAEYMAVKHDEAVLKPDNVAILEAAASSSAITAHNAVMDHVNEGDRVLILGGSGGVGSAAIQIAKHHAKASFVATTSTQEELCKSLGADQVIDYRTDDWWKMEWSGKKFDKIIDTVGGGNFYGKADNGKVLKTRARGGEFIAVCGDDPQPDCRTVWRAIKFVATTALPWRSLYTKIYSRRLPKYSLLMPYEFPKGRRQVLGWMEAKKLQIPLDSASPHPFTETGVQEAFQVVANHHAHGKVVVSMTESAGRSK